MAITGIAPNVGGIGIGDPFFQNVILLMPFNDRVFVSVGDSGSIQSSNDGTTWTNRLGANTNNQNGVTYSNSVFVAVGNSGSIQTSNDGITWSNRTTANTNNQNGVTYGNGMFVAVGDSGSIQTSTDGTTWTNRTTANTNNQRGVAYGNGVYVSVGDSGSIQTSTNGTTWTNRTRANTNQQRAVAYGNGVYVSVGASGSIQSSIDGTTWTNRATANTNTQNGVAYGNGVFVAVGGSGSIQTSTDGTTWTNRTTANTNNQNGVTYRDYGLFVAVGDSGSIQTSTNGTTWTNRATANINNQRGVAYGFSVTGQQQYGAAQTMTIIGDGNEPDESGPRIDSSIFLYGGGSIYFDGNDDNIHNTSGSYWDFGTNDFTVEFAFRTSEKANNRGILDLRSSTSSNGPMFETLDNNSGTLRIRVAGNSRTLVLSNNRWYQVAMSRVGNFIYCYVDGTLLYEDDGLGGQIGPIDATGVSLTSNQFTCGTYVDQRGSGTSFRFKGWVDQIRITRGVGRYSGATYQLQGSQFPNY